VRRARVLRRAVFADDPVVLAGARGQLSALADTVVFIARYPPNIFGKFLATFFTYVLPLAFLGAVPALALKEGVRATWLLAACS
jgi:ABC-type uncharacterized transport system permease subunit